MISTALKLLCTATLTLGTVSVAHAQFGNLLKDLEKAAKELEKGIQQGTNPGQEPTQTSPESATTPGVKSPDEGAQSVSADVTELRNMFVGTWSTQCTPTEEVVLSTWTIAEGKLVLAVNRVRRSEGTSTRLTDATEINFALVDSGKGLVKISMDRLDRLRNKKERRESIFKITKDTRQTIDITIDEKLVVKNGRVVETNQPLRSSQVIRCTEEQVAQIMPVPDVPKDTEVKQVAQIMPVPYVPKDREAAWDSFIKSKATEIVEYDEKSKEVAKKSKTKWKSFTQKDAMSGTQSVIVRTEGKVGSGSYTADLTCRSGVNPSIRLELNLQNARPPVRRIAPGATLMIADGRERVNGSVTPTMWEQDEKFGNVFFSFVSNVFEGRFAQTRTFGFTVDGKWKVVNSNDPYKIYEDCRKSNNSNACYHWQGGDLKQRFAPLSYVYDSAYELTTNAGAIFLEVPPGNTEIRKLLDSCQAVSK